jgi:DNA-binding helix-hairpin-helix protein with protein kinase domain
MDVRFYQSDGRTVTLGRSLGSGGEAFVHEIHEDPTLAAKIYRIPQASHHEKLVAMIGSALPQKLDTTGHVGIVWPRSLLFSVTSGSFRGFLMNKVPHLRPSV